MADMALAENSSHMEKVRALSLFIFELGHVFFVFVAEHAHGDTGMAWLHQQGGARPLCAAAAVGKSTRPGLSHQNEGRCKSLALNFCLNASEFIYLVMRMRR
jgi:hypothetical protein